MSSRVREHNIKNLFLTSPTLYSTEISAASGVTIVAPATGEHLEIWQIDIDASASNSANTGVDIRAGGPDGERLAFKQLGVGSSAVITYGGLPKKVFDNIWIHTITEPAFVQIAYVTRKTRTD